MKRMLSLCATCLLVLSAAVPAHAQSLIDAKFALHAQTKTLNAAEICVVNDPNTQGIPCSQYTTAWPLGVSADMYLVIGRVDPSAGTNGVRLGIDYNGALGAGVDEFGWTLCSDGLEFPNTGPNGIWPAAGAGNTITWVTCQQTVIPPDDAHAVVGSFYVYAYSPDTFVITPNNNTVAGPELQLADCSGQITDFPANTMTGSVDFGGGAGFTPCTAPPPPSVSFDFEPGSCPNELVDGNGGFVTAAIVGQTTLPVSMIDQATIRVEGVAPARIMVRDLATPFPGTPCDCHAAGADGMDDLQLRISRPALIAALGPVSPGDQVVLTVTGQLVGGTPFSATDCATIATRGGGPASADLGLTSDGSASGSTRISYSVPRDGNVRLAVFDVSGRKVGDLVNGFQAAGTHRVDWNAEGHPSGIYFYRLTAGNHIKTQKLMLLR